MPKIVERSAMVAQCGRSIIDAEIEPIKGMHIAAQLFGAGASVHIKTEAKIYGSLELLSEREGAVCGSLDLQVRAAMRD